MRTRRSNYPNNSNVIIRRRRRKQVSNIVEPEIQTIVAPMAERIMEELLRAPTEGYGEAIVLTRTKSCDHFEIKTNLLSVGPSIPTNPSPKKVVERETEETTDKEQTNFQVSTAQIPPSVIPSPIPEPDVPKTLPKTTPILNFDIPKSLPKPNIPYPSRRDDQKSRDKASNQMEKIFQIFQDLRFDISFVDALTFDARFAPTLRLQNEKEKQEVKNLAEPTVKRQTRITPCLKNFKVIFDFLVHTIFSDSNKDECLTPKDDIEILLHHDPSTPLKSVAFILEGFINDHPFEENDDFECKTNDWKRILYDAPIDEAECFDPGGDNDEINAFLAIEVPTDDTTHNLYPEVFFDHEPQQLRNEPENEPLITFSPKSDPLHHEFTGELITIPPGISPENSHTIIESLPTSTTLVENSDSNREEIDIFSGPDDSIPPGIESDFDSEEDIIDNLLNDDSTHERLTFNIEPDAPVINNVDEL
ncbi:hypothetical protein Tco_0790242 [Tanacetum coccineum]